MPPDVEYGEDPEGFVRNQDSPIRVLVADDHPLMLEGLCTVIQAQPDMHVVAQAETGKQVIDAYQRCKPDVVLLDLRLPDLDGIQLIETIRRDSPDARIIILTTYSGDEFIYRALKAGARAYLLKTMPKAELIQTIRAVMEGQRCVPPEVASKLAERLPVSDLTPRELEVLKLVALGKKNKEIAAELKVTQSAIKYHINIILSKMGASDRTEAATLALQRGIILLD